MFCVDRPGLLPKPDAVKTVLPNGGIFLSRRRAGGENLPFMQD